MICNAFQVSNLSQAAEAAIGQALYALCKKEGHVRTPAIIDNVSHKQKRIAIEERRDDICVYLRRNGPRTIRQIAKRAGISTSTAQKDLRFLKREGRVTFNGEKWCVPCVFTSKRA